MARKAGTSTYDAPIAVGEWIANIGNNKWPRYVKVDERARAMAEGKAHA
mgnify:CR=1 FL=1